MGIFDESFYEAKQQNYKKSKLQSIIPHDHKCENSFKNENQNYIKIITRKMRLI